MGGALVLTFAAVAAIPVAILVVQVVFTFAIAAICFTKGFEGVVLRPSTRLSDGNPGYLV